MSVYTVAPYLREREFTRRSGVRYQEWRDRAACRGEDVNLFFPEDGMRAAGAKAICARCPVTAHCLMFAISSPERHGVWGNLSERERRGMRPPQDIATTPQEVAAA